MKVSVIIPTYNGQYRIGNVLKALSLQSIKDFETIIVIDGSTDGTMKFLQQGEFGIQYNIHYQGNKGRAAVRNKGAELATGDLLIFFDDDMRPEPMCITEHIKHHEKHPNSLMSGAQIDDYQKADSDFLKYKCIISRKWASTLFLYKDQQLPLHNLYLTAANFSVTKELFHKLGGFDERLRDAEDFDLAIRAYKSNIAVYYNHDAFAWHDDIVSFSKYINRLREYQQAHIKLRQIKPEQYNDIELRRPKMPKGLKKVIFSFFASKFCFNLVERMHTYLPVRLRHKLYDLVTTAYGTFFTNRAL